jgi:hypothetical protein
MDDIHTQRAQRDLRKQVSMTVNGGFPETIGLRF